MDAEEDLRQLQSKNAAFSNSITHQNRSEEVRSLLLPLLDQLTSYLAEADNEIEDHRAGSNPMVGSSVLLKETSLSAQDLPHLVRKALTLPEYRLGREGILETIQDVLDHSVNTTAPGFLDKLYGSPLPPGVAAELVLAVLNTNVHVYQVAPMLTLIEKTLTRELARMFGMKGPRAGGINVQGGSASNLTSIVLARNSLFPHTKVNGNSAQNNGKLILFTSVHGHYSIEKAAQAVGLGSRNVVTVPVDAQGQMVPSELDRLIQESKEQGCSPFYINATAGSTVLGSFDPFDEIADVAKKHHCWFHIDGAWGGSFVFARRPDLRNRLAGAEKADSIAINPHKMLGVPLTCSFLLTRDLKLLQSAMTLRAGYLFHDAEDDELSQDTSESDQDHDSRTCSPGTSPSSSHLDTVFGTTDGEDESWKESNDLADLTLQCGRRGDSFKFFLSWQYYGTSGYSDKVEHAYDVALEFSKTIDESESFTLVLGKSSRPQCLQVCYYYTPRGKFVFRSADEEGLLRVPNLKTVDQSSNRLSLCRKIGKFNTLVTSRMCKALILRGFMVDFAPALEGQEDKGSFFRVVVNISMIRETVHRLISVMSEVGEEVVQELSHKYG